MYNFFIKLCRAVVCVTVSVGSFFSFTPANKEIAQIKQSPLKLPANFTVTAHAGAMSTRDNSLWSVKQIVVSGVDIIEFDVSFRPDGTPVIIHKDEPSQRQGTLFTEAIAIVAAHESMNINLDLKSILNLPLIQEIAAEYNMLERVFFTGVSKEKVESVKRDCPLIPFYLNSSADDGEGDIDKLNAIADEIIDCGAIGINLSFTNISPELCELMHERGLLVSAYTLKKTLNMHEMLALGVDNITTTKPIKLFKLIENWRSEH